MITQTELITSWQALNIEKMEAKIGRSWTEFASVKAGTPAADMPAAIFTATMKAMIAEARIVDALDEARTPAAPVRSASLDHVHGQDGRCMECGGALDHLSAGGYCFDCQ